jgi:murein L,D-transpeptidase YafK
MTAWMVLVVASVANDAHGTRTNVAIDHIVIAKSRRRLTTFVGSHVVSVYHVALGRGGAGRKRYEGDGRTPEGAYHVDELRRSARFGWFLHLDYPNASDVAAFRVARARGSLPPHATIGGEIGIHGEERGYAWLPGTWLNWTQGCIALESGDIESLRASVRVGTTVEIVP